MGSTLSPAEAIVDFLKKSGADLAVLGARGRSAMMTWFLGTVAERIVRESPCSVLTVKPEGFRFDVD
jgi:nucleotide-binding universal stress UspA family protein